jgi:general secretion pathway protein J
VGGNAQGRGFTLVELLVAIFIFAIVVSSVYGVYRSTFEIVHGSESLLAASRAARVAMERMTDDLTAIVGDSGGALQGEKHDIAGARGDSLAFVSSIYPVLSKTETFNGYSSIVYTVELDKDAVLLNLYRSESVLLPGGDAEEKDILKEILAQGLIEMRITYLDKDGSKTDEWRSDEGQKMLGEKGQQAEPLLPALIYLQLTFGKSIDSKGGIAFETAVALPQKSKSKQ